MAMEFYNDWFGRALTSLLILIIGILAGKIVSKGLGKILQEIELDKIIHELAARPVPASKSISLFVQYLVWVFALLFALRQIGVDVFVINVLIGAVIFIVIVSMLLLLKDAIPNSVAGIIIMKKKIFSEDDEISIGDVRGKVKQFTLTRTVLVTSKGDEIYFPNSSLIKEKIIKKSS